MRPTEIKDLVIAITTIVLFTISVEQYPRLEIFAKKEATKSLRGWRVHRFFSKNY